VLWNTYVSHRGVTPLGKFTIQDISSLSPPVIGAACRTLRVSTQELGLEEMTRRWISAGAFVDFGDAGAAVVALDGVFAGVAVAAVDLDGFVGDAGVTRGRLR
jgi:hypothetical protein